MFSSVNDIIDHPARPAEETLVLATELLGTISAIRRIARRAARLVWQDEPLPPAQSELLRLAAAQPGLSVADAARELRLAPNTVSTLVGRLTAAGLLDRARAVSDGRSVRLSVTEAPGGGSRAGVTCAPSWAPGPWTSSPPPTGTPSPRPCPPCNVSPPS
jgi:DNA-binding CsgD family transcriptional regulator